MSTDKLRIVVVGAGIAGLATAWLVRESARQRGRPIELAILEAKAEPGGFTRTEHTDGYVCEWGANGFLDNEPATLELVAKLGLSGRLVAADEAASRRYVYHSGQLHQLPTGPLTFLRSTIVPPQSKLRMALELLVPPKRDGRDESIHDFGRRRLGAGFARYLLDPMVSGIFAGDTRRLSLPAAFPKIAELEQRHGGLFRGLFARMAARRRSPAPAGAKAGPAGPGGTLHTFREGMGELTAELGRRLQEHLTTGAPVRAVSRRAEGFEVQLDGRSVAADVVVLACPAHATSGIVAGLAPAVGKSLAEISFPPLTVLCEGYPQAAVSRPLYGFGVLIPRSEGLRILGVLCSDRIFPGQAPPGTLLLRTLIGGAHDEAAGALGEPEVTAVVRADLAQLLGVTGPPEMLRCFRHQQAIAQYDLGHLDRVAAVDRLEHELPGLFFTGASYRGVSVNGCVKDAFRITRALDEG